MVMVTRIAEQAGLSARKKHIPKRELRVFGFAALGQGMIYAIMSGYISDFYINVLQVPLLFVLLLMLFARIWDAVNDPLMGMIVDRLNPARGKLKPYILFTALPMAIMTFLMFFDPGLGKTETMAYAGVVYVAWGMIYTASDVPFWSLPNVLTPNPDERTTAIGVARIFNGVGSALPVLLFTVLGFVLPLFSKRSSQEIDRQKYMIMAIISSVLGIILFVNSYFHVKERVPAPVRAEKKKGDPGVLRRIFKCKPLMLVVLMGILSGGRYMMQAAAVHVARYAFYIGPDIASVPNPARAIQASITTVNIIFTICSAVGMFGAMLLMPVVYKKYDYRRVIIASCLGGAAACAVTAVLGAVSIYKNIGYLFYVCIPFIIVQCIPLGTLNVTAYAMIDDCLDYMEWETGFRDNALGSACQSFVNKLGNALATAAIILTYMAISLDPRNIYSSSAVISAAELSADKRFAMFGLVSIIPGISLLLCVVPIFFYDVIGKKRDGIIAELEERRKAAAETETISPKEELSCDI